MSLHPLLLLLCFLVASSVSAEDGRSDLFRQSRELAHGLRVLSVSLSPGQEDLSTLTWLHHAYGAAITSVYVSNGEGGDNDERTEYPNQLAATRRYEADRAIGRLHGEVQFLNLPDIPAARDTGRVRIAWPVDSLVLKLMVLITQAKPHLVILSPDREYGISSPRHAVVAGDLRRAVRQLSTAHERSRGEIGGGLPPWDVERTLFPIASGEGLVSMAGEQHPLIKRSYRHIAADISQEYRSLKASMPAWVSTEVRYEVIGLDAKKAVKGMVEGLPAPPVKALSKTHFLVKGVAKTAREHSILRKPLSGKQKQKAIIYLVTALDSVEFHLGRSLALDRKNRSLAAHWKLTLEELRNYYLGARVFYRFEDSILTERQVTNFHVDSIRGLSQTGTTELFFAQVDPKGWIVNEYWEKKLAWVPGGEMRILSPPSVSYDLPAATEGLLRSTIGTDFTVFIIHRGRTKEESFSVRIRKRFLHAPRFSAEVLTPIIPLVPGASVAYRLTNNTRDGIRDVLGFSDSVAYSSLDGIQLSSKGATVTDTLSISWNPAAPDGDHMMSLQFGGVDVAQFAARKLSVQSDTTKTVGFVPATDGFLLRQSLGAIGYRPRELSPGSGFGQSLHGLSVLILERRVLTLQPDLAKHTPELLKFVEDGGHLVLLSQDADVMNRTPLWERVSFVRAFTFDDETEVRVDTNVALANIPNRLNSNDFGDWLFRVASNEVKVISDQGVCEVPASAGNVPMVLSQTRGRGRMTYVELALEPQLLNVHRGALRLLANLIAR